MLLACGEVTEPVVTLPIAELETSVHMSQRWIARSNPPDSVVFSIRVRNQYPFTVRILPESSRAAAGDAFTGLGIRWTHEIRLAGEPSGGRGSSMTWYEYTLPPGQSLWFPYVLRPYNGDWGPDRTWHVHSTIQGMRLPLLIYRVRAHEPCLTFAGPNHGLCSRP